MIRYLGSISNGMFFQKMMATPKAKYITKKATPKMDRNRFAGDFCLSLYLLKAILLSGQLEENWYGVLNPYRTSVLDTR